MRKVIKYAKKMQRMPMFKMADNRVKQECKFPKRFIDEFPEAKRKNNKKLKAADRNIYPVQITGWQSEKHG